ncbi:hypothetical protein B1218_33015, partial [Pseudomonas ogarae]
MTEVARLKGYCTQARACRDLAEGQAQAEPVGGFHHGFAEEVKPEREQVEANAMTRGKVDAGGRRDCRMRLVKGLDALGFTCFSNYAGGGGQQETGGTEQEVSQSEDGRRDRRRGERERRTAQGNGRDEQRRGAEAITQGRASAGRRCGPPTLGLALW